MVIVDQAAGLTGVEAILRSIRKTDLTEEDAFRIAAELKARGFPVEARPKDSIEALPLEAFLQNFWDYKNSPYVRDKLTHGYRIGKRHCHESLKRVHYYITPSFEGWNVGDITRDVLKEFANILADVGLRPNSIQQIMHTITTPFKWACQEGKLALNPCAGMLKFHGAEKKRGVLTPQEAEKIFSVSWKDKRVYVGNLLAITTGLRAGEVLALRKRDIGAAENFLYIRHSWSRIDGLKTPKNGESRKVPLLPEVREKLLELIEENPHRTDNPFVFYGPLQDKPMAEELFLKGLKKVCRDYGIDAAARNIVFHSHRHYYAARMVDRMAPDQVIRITGHKSMAVFEKYADHIIQENLEAAGEVTAEVFGNILQFKRGA
ncbi:MAG: tyrosine-type recombinase/integrase [Treponema sp.]|nr:tyrosine-type recombinase/integrase [Treponema sp.]